MRWPSHPLVRCSYGRTCRESRTTGNAFLDTTRRANKRRPWPFRVTFPSSASANGSSTRSSCVELKLFLVTRDSHLSFAAESFSPSRNRTITKHVSTHTIIVSSLIKSESVIFLVVRVHFAGLKQPNVRSFVFAQSNRVRSS